MAVGVWKRDAPGIERRHGKHEAIPLPFPLTAEESELFKGDRLTRELGIQYTPFREGLEKTFRSFRSVYE